ncbi:hypothetical protein D3C72_1942200 [compost metagenome]
MVEDQRAGAVAKAHPQRCQHHTRGRRGITRGGADIHGDGRTRGIGNSESVRCFDSGAIGHRGGAVAVIANEEDAGGSEFGLRAVGDDGAFGGCVETGDDLKRIDQGAIGCDQFAL